MTMLDFPRLDKLLHTFCVLFHSIYCDKWMQTLITIPIVKNASSVDSESLSLSIMTWFIAELT